MYGLVFFSPIAGEFFLNQALRGTVRYTICKQEDRILLPSKNFCSEQLLLN